MSVTVYCKLKIFAGKQFIRWFFSVVLMNKKCVKKCNSLGITVGVGQSKFRYNIVYFDKKRSLHKEILSEVVKMIVVTWDHCISVILGQQTGDNKGLSAMNPIPPWFKCTLVRSVTPTVVTLCVCYSLLFCFTAFSWLLQPRQPCWGK